MRVRVTASSNGTNGATAPRPLKAMIAGAPAAGKGTQCARIVEEFGMVHISAGDLLREEVARGTEAGKAAKECMDRGHLVPDEVVVQMVKNRLAAPDVQQRGWLLDGYPRSASQAEAIEKEGIRPDVFLLLDVPDGILVERVVGRRLDPDTGKIYHLKFNPPPADVVDRLQQRSDDTEDKVKSRLEVHHANVNAVLGYYQQELVEIDGQRSMDAVFSSVAQVLREAKERINDPMEAFCGDNPAELECKVFDE